jgi:probable rRNA maturation factor
MEILVHNQSPDSDIDLSFYKKLTIWSAEKVKLPAESITVIFVGDEELTRMHGEFLDDPTPTDVITFDLGEEGAVEGEIYISTERAAEQATQYGVSHTEELMRLIIHGLLHLAGFDDLEEEARSEMKRHEDYYVQMAVDKFL